MGGILGGKQTSTVALPSYITNASQQALAQAQKAGQIGYVPYMGPDVAALTPAQTAAFDANNQALSAFGLPTAGIGLPQATQYAGGVSGYSGFPVYQQALEQLKATNPAQYAAITGSVMDPVTGMPTMTPQSPMQAAQRSRSRSGGVPMAVSGGGGAGYTGLLDMINGGGPGASGATFTGGGLLSGVANRVTRPWGSR